MDKDIIRTSTVFYESFVASTRDLPGDDFKRAWLALFDYAFYGEEPGELDPLLTMFYKMAKPNLDRNFQNRENGLNGGRPKKPSVSDKKPKSKSVSDKKPMVMMPETEHIFDEDVDVDVDEAVDGDVVVDVSASSVETDNNTLAHALRPSPVKIISAFDAKDYSLADGELQRFAKYNDDHGWKMPLDDAVDAWIANARKEKPASKPKNKFTDIEQHDYKHDVIEMAHLQKQMALPPMEGRNDA